MPLTRSLNGLRVLDLTRLLPGPFGTQILADLGADVIKVEQPGMGDYLRLVPPHVDGAGARFRAVNRGKRSIALDLAAPSGRDAALRLAAGSDVVVEGFRPGVLDRLGLGFEALCAVRPDVILCSISGYGQDGPFRERAGHDLNYLALSGLLAEIPACGSERHPAPLPIQIADLVGGGLYAVVAILAALQERSSSAASVPSSQPSHQPGPQPQPQPPYQAQAQPQHHPGSQPPYQPPPQPPYQAQAQPQHHSRPPYQAQAQAQPQHHPRPQHRPRHLDISMTESVLALMASELAELLAYGPDARPAPGQGLLSGGHATYGMYRTADGGYLSVGSLEPKFAGALAGVVGFEARADEMLAGPERQAELASLLRERLAERTLAEWTPLFAEVDACVEPVLGVEELPAHPQHVARGVFRRALDGSLSADGPVQTPCTRIPPDRRAPSVGEHTVAILREAGLSDAEVTALLESGVAEQSPVE